MTDNRGLIIVNTGPGKGKTTAALGASIRASGRGFKVFILQFIKRRETGEWEGLRGHERIEIKPMGLGMVKGNNKDKHRFQARLAWEECRKRVMSNHYGLIVLDEICLALHHEFLSKEEVLDLLKAKPPALHIILTGRHCPDEILEAADTVTFMNAEKHHMNAGIKAQAGIEF